MYTLILVFILLILNIVIFKEDRGRYFFSISMLMSWWLVWLLISEVNDGIKPPAPEIGYHVINYVLFIVLGGLLCKSLSRSKVYFSGGVNILYFRRFSLLISIPMLIWVIYLAVISLNLHFSSGYAIRDLREQFFSFSDSGNLWFDSKLIWSVYLTFFGIVIHYMLVVSIPIFIERKNIILLVVFLLLVIFDMILKSSRGMLYAIGICYIYVSILALSGVGGSKISRSGVIRGLSLLSLIVIFVAFFSLQRGHSIVGGFFNYHTVGFSLFSNIIEMNGSYEHLPLELGRLTTGGIDYLFTTAIRYVIDPAYNSPVYLNTIIQDQNIVTGDQSIVSPELAIYVSHNAFYTILSTVYLDFGTLGPMILGLITGYYLVYFEKSYMDNRSIWALIMLVFIFYNSIAGIFASPLETPGFWGVVVLLFYSSKFFKSRRWGK